MRELIAFFFLVQSAFFESEKGEGSGLDGFSSKKLVNSFPSVPVDGEESSGVSSNMINNYNVSWGKKTFLVTLCR